MTLPPRKNSKGHLSPAHRAAPAQEAALARQYGGQVTRGSGNQVEKGDVRVKRLARLECKSTTAKSFSVTRDMVDKIESAAAQAGEVPALCVDFVDANAHPTHQLVIMPLWALNELMERAR